MKKFVLIFASLMLIACGGNRYLRDFSGSKNPKGKDRCYVVNAELEERFRSGKSFEEILDDYKAQGFWVLGMGKGRSVKKTKHLRKLKDACDEIGGDIVLYDNPSKMIVYLYKPAPNDSRCSANGACYRKQ